jgi:hypothetical protein
LQAPNTAIKEIDLEIVKLQTELLSEKDYKKLQNKLKNQYVKVTQQLMVLLIIWLRIYYTVM